MGFKSAALIFVAAWLTIACSSCARGPEPTVSPLESPLSTSPVTQDSPLASPQPSRGEQPAVEAFRLHKPIPAGSTKVTGSGPPNVPVLLLDITATGRLLAAGVIGEDGGFELTTNEPLQSRHRIGITLGDLSTTPWEAGDFSDDGFYGDDALTVPQVGFFYDTYMVRE